MSARSSLLSSQCASKNHPGQRALRILADAQGPTPACSARTAQALQRQWNLAPTGTLHHIDLPRPIAYPAAAAAAAA